MTRAIILFFLANVQLAWCALPAATVWEVRTTGADTNGGGFVAGASGTDMSVFDNKNAAGCSSCQSATVNISVTDGVTAGTTTITSATANFSAAIVGNIINVSGGTGAVVSAWYEVVTFTNSTTIVVDRSTGLTAGTGVTLNIGGAFLTLAQLATVMVADNKAFIKAGTGYTVTASPTFTFSSGGPDATHPGNYLIGYTTTRTDGGRATITLSTNAGLAALKFTGSGYFVKNFVFDGANLATSICVDASASSFTTVENVLCKHFKNLGIWMGGENLVGNSEIGPATTPANGGIDLTAQGVISRVYVHDLTGAGGDGIVGFSGMSVIFSIFANLGGSGVTNTGRTAQIYNNTFYNNAGDGIKIGSFMFSNVIRNNIFSNNTGYGINSASAAYPAQPWFDGNAYFSNTAGTRHNLDDTTTNPQDGVGAYTNVLDIALTASPFTNAAGGDFTLNNTAGGGAAIRGHGVPGAMPGLSQTGAMSMGSFQQASSGGGTTSTSYVQ